MKAWAYAYERCSKLGAKIGPLDYIGGEACADEELEREGYLKIVFYELLMPKPRAGS